MRALGAAGARGADLADAGGGAFEADDDRALVRPAPDDFAPVRPELALLLLLLSLDRVWRLVFAAFSEPVFGGIGGWPSCVCDVGCALPSCCFVELRLPVAG